MTNQIVTQWIHPSQAMPPIDSTHSAHVIIHDEIQGTMRACFNYKDFQWKSFPPSDINLNNVIAWFPMPPDPIIVPAEPNSEIPTPQSPIPNPQSDGQT